MSCKHVMRNAGSVLVHTGSAGLSLVAWVTAGVIAMMGTLTYAELGTCFPESGGMFDDH